MGPPGGAAQLAFEGYVNALVSDVGLGQQLLEFQRFAVAHAALLDSLPRGAGFDRVATQAVGVLESKSLEQNNGEIPAVSTLRSTLLERIAQADDELRGKQAEILGPERWPPSDSQDGWRVLGAVKVSGGEGQELGDGSSKPYQGAFLASRWQSISAIRYQRVAPGKEPRTVQLPIDLSLEQLVEAGGNWPNSGDVVAAQFRNVVNRAALGDEGDSPDAHLVRAWCANDSVVLFGIAIDADGEYGINPELVH